MYRIGRLLTNPPSRFIPFLRNARNYSSYVEDGTDRRTSRGFATQAAAEPFLNGSSSTYVEEMYIAWQRDPSSVHVVCTDFNSL